MPQEEQPKMDREALKGMVDAFLGEWGENRKRYKVLPPTPTPVRKDVGTKNPPMPLPFGFEEL